MAELHYVDWDGLVYYDGKIKNYVNDKIHDCLKMGGILAYKDLPRPSIELLNYIYKVSDELLTNEDFENPGYEYPAGTWVQVCNFNNIYKYIIFNEHSIGGTADLSNYYTKSETRELINTSIEALGINDIKSSLTNKADDVLFKTNMIVGTALGSFAQGDSLQNMHLSEIIVKLLNLSEYVEPDVPEAPEGSSEIVQEIITNSIPMYIQDTEGNLIETEFKNTSWTQEESTINNEGETTFYTIIDSNDSIIESGYQASTEYNEEAWLTIALPSNIQNVIVKMYDPDVSDWVRMNWIVVKSDEQNIENYTVWSVPEEYEVQSGDTYRFVIID